MKLKAEKRNNSEKDFSEVLGEIYGNKKDNISIKLNYNDFEKVLDNAGTSSIVTLDVDGEEHGVIIKDYQINPRNDRIHHVDFYAFTRGQEMEAAVGLNFVGEAPAEKLGMVLNTAKTEILVAAMPKDLPSEIEVDLSVLVDGDSVIRNSDLILPEGVKIVGEPEEAIVSVVAAKEVGEEDDNEAPDLSEEVKEGENNVEEKTNDLKES